MYGARSAQRGLQGLADDAGDLVAVGGGSYKWEGGTESDERVCGNGGWSVGMR
jgi:hypothetical protein